MKNSLFRYLNLISEIGLVIGITTIGGVLIGIWIDGKFGTKGFFTVSLMLIGLSGGLIAVYKLIKEVENDEGSKRT